MGIAHSAHTSHPRPNESLEQDEDKIFSDCTPLCLPPSLSIFLICRIFLSLFPLSALFYSCVSCVAHCTSERRKGRRKNEERSAMNKPFGPRAHVLPLSLSCTFRLAVLPSPFLTFSPHSAPLKYLTWLEQLKIQIQKLYRHRGETCCLAGTSVFFEMQLHAFIQTSQSLYYIYFWFSCCAVRVDRFRS